MNLSLHSKFGATSLHHSSILNSLQPPMIPNSSQNFYLMQIIQQYQNQAQINEQTEQQKQQSNDIQINNIEQICVESYIKNNLKPVRMFKDKMDLKKQNNQKKIIVKQLESINQKLKMEYDASLGNNKKMEMFLKQIQFTFKNDRSNQKANQTLLKATKTLHRQKQQSKKYIQKLVKTAKTNQMRQLKTYLKVLQNERKRISNFLKTQMEQNSKLRTQQDFNHSQLQCFQICQNLTTQILQSGLNYTFKLREQYKKQRSIIKIALTHKQVQHIKRQINKIDFSIAEQLLKKQGYEYEIEVLKNKQKQRNKYFIKQQGSILKQHIKVKKRRIGLLNQQLKQKIKTQEYLTKWTKQLKLQLEQLKQKHISIKQQYEQEINKLSREIQEWNRKYKAELIQQQSNHRKGGAMSKDGGSLFGYQDASGHGIGYGMSETASNSHGNRQQRKVKVVKLHQIERLIKKITYFCIQNRIKPIQFIYSKVFPGGKSISLKQLYGNLLRLQAFQQQQDAQVYKLARYIIEDNNNNYKKIGPQEHIETSLAVLIFKNLLNSQINYANIDEIRQNVKKFLLVNFDQIRHEIWVNSGKSLNFTFVNLKNSFSKYIKQEITIIKYSECVQYLIWKKFNQQQLFRLTNFQKVCQVLLGKKLVKDNHNRMSRLNIRSVFDRLYEGNEDAIDKAVQNRNPQNQSLKQKTIPTAQQQKWEDYCKQQ